MKTAQQIKQYLGKQEWFNKFSDNLNKPREQKEKFLNGYMGKYTIANAFNWQNTEEGRYYWQTIEDNFQLWYNESPPIDDWEEKRYGLARDLFMQRMRSSWDTGERDAFLSVKYADMLINELKRG